MDIACHVCGSRRYWIFGTCGRNRIVICRECALFYVNPIPGSNNLMEYVEKSDQYTQDQLEKISFFRARAGDLFKRIEKIIPPGRILDIGCAIGTALIVARERGWEGTGIELSYSSVEIAKRRGIKIISTPIEDAPLDDEYFDLITMNHVLEHIVVVEPFFQKIIRIMRPKGLLYISVPNVKAWQFYLKRRNYAWTFHNDHFIHFSVTTLERLIRKYGFKIIEIYTSRWRDFHDGLNSHSLLFRTINNVVERMGMGIEIHCLAQKDGAFNRPKDLH